MAADEPWLCSGYWLSILRISLCAREKKKAWEWTLWITCKKCPWDFSQNQKNTTLSEEGTNVFLIVWAGGISVTHVGCLYWFIGPQSLCDKGAHFM